MIHDFEFRAPAVIVASGGIGGNHDLVRQNWPQRMGRVPEQLLSGVPAHVDGRMIGIAEKAGARVINRTGCGTTPRASPTTTRSGRGTVSGSSRTVVVVAGRHRQAAAGTAVSGIRHARHAGVHRPVGLRLHLVRAQRQDHRKGIRAVGPRAKSRPHRTQCAPAVTLARRIRPPGPVQAFVDRGVDFVTAHSLRELVTAMNTVPDVVPLDYATVAAEVTARDREVANRFSKDSQITAIRAARGYWGDRLGRVVAPHRLTDPKAGPLIAVKLHILTRKTLGGLETDLDSRVLKADGTPLDGLYAAGEAAGFGGGACTATGRWKVRSSAAASFPVVPPAAPPPPTSPRFGCASRR
ncbi:ksdD-like steroid dehydrogenase [Mycobacterium xenopi 4042]|uniref:KsdD-like steroid dehydrogenase n=1 Tax=Mycobacterium xenopi 4042 TaxID=1299334 RepID=X7ZXN4_MYCXE|nr:ksdD-like steroid dehydrogenase [Mycobacterium xenopi 4042]